MRFKLYCQQLLLSLFIYFFAQGLLQGANLVKPSLYELGFAFIDAFVPDYPASDESRNHSYILPVGRYRGSVFKSDDEGTRAEFYTDKNLRLNLSFSGSLPARSENNEAREGMSDLDFLVELGPRVQISLLPAKSSSLFFFEIPLRFMSSVNTSFQKIYWNNFCASV